MFWGVLGWIYQRLPYLHAIIGFLEMILALVRLGFFFTPYSNGYPSIRKNYSSTYVVAFIFDWISSTIPTLIGIFTIIILLVVCFKLCAICLNYANREKKSSQIDHSNTLRTLLRNKGVRRFFILDCNCPFYKARPQLRFRVRLTILIIFFICRIIAISLYAASQSTEGDGSLLSGLCALSLLFLFSIIFLDVYRYCVWWHYTPEKDTKIIGRSKKHLRYIPYHLVGDMREPNRLGDRPCVENPCQKRALEHIAVFHGNDYQPQARWRDIPKPALIKYNDKTRPFCLDSGEDDNQPHYIGFHTTDPDAAVSIASSEFRPGSNGWLGPGVYFARSIAATFGKAKSSGGAHIIAEIRMGKVYEVHRTKIDRTHKDFDKQIFDFVHKGAWQKDYNTCYMIHPDEYKDEFAIRDAASQIVKWVIVINKEFDSKVELYGLNREFDSTQCFCV